MNITGESLIGRKVFFLNPHSVMQEQLVEVIFQAEYEVYLIRDHIKAHRLLARFPDSILFVNVDERVHGVDWMTYISDFLTNPATKSTRIGVLSYNENPELAKRYLMELSIPCGFVRLRLGLRESARILIQALEANEARGKRKHVRVSISRDTIVTFNVKMGRTLLRGYIRDISVAGMACHFERSVPETGETLEDIQLNLRGAIARVAGAVAGMRSTSEGRLYVIVFAQNDDGDSRHKIQSFVYATLQAQMDRLIQTL